MTTPQMILVCVLLSAQHLFAQIPCDTLTAPQNTYAAVLQNELILRWDTVYGAVACEGIANTPVITNGRRAVLQDDPFELRIPMDRLVPGVYDWKLRCACSLDPLQATPFSVSDTFVVPDSFNCGSVTDIDGNTYTGVLIGSQCWMQQNLKTTRYADGTAMVEGSGAGDILGDHVTRYYFSYNETAAYADTFGYLYTWPAIMNGAASSDLVPSGVQGPCPDGWHVPSRSEYRILSDYLGGRPLAGGPLKDTVFWIGPNVNASNASGFNGLPAGDRIDLGDFVNLYLNADFWSTTEGSSTNAYIRCLFFEKENFSEALNVTGRKAAGFSCRCIKND